MHDAQLINGIRKGDHDTFRFIFDHYYALMCSIAYEYVEDYHLSQNIAEACSAMDNAVLSAFFRVGISEI